MGYATVTHPGKSTLIALTVCLVGFSFLTTGLIYAQTPDTESNPSLQYADGDRTLVSVEVPLDMWNEALRAAGQPEIEPNAPILPITVTFEVPSPKVPGFPTGAPRSIIGPVAQVDPPDAATPSPLITGLDFDDNAALTGGSLFIPPDSHGAAGTSHICHVVNVAIDCVTKAGVAVAGFPDDLAGFFASLSPLTATFDPKVLYDHVEDRYVVVTLEQTAEADGDAADTSRILLAVSDDGDPEGTWHFQAIDAKESISGTDHWFDYPGFALDEDAIYITGNMFTFDTGVFGGERLWIVDKGVGTGGLYDGGASTATSFDPFGEIGSAGLASTLQPALMFGEPPAPPAPATEVGTWLVEYSGLTSSGSEALLVIRVDDPLGTPTFTDSFVALGDIDDTATGMPDAPQLDDGAGPPSPVAIETNDRRSLDAVWRGDELWMTTQVVPGTAGAGSKALMNVGEATAHWVEVSTSTLGTPALSQQGNIGGEDIASGAYTFFPSVAVNSIGDVAFGFSASASTIFAGAYATGRFDADPAGTVTASSTLKAGEASYVRTFGGANRWGDYSGTVVDPVDDGFWVINQIAGDRGTPSAGPEDGRWEVYLGKFGTGLLPVELIAFEAVDDGGDVRLIWSTASETNNAGFEVQHLQRGIYQTLDFVEGAGTTTEPQQYSYRAEDVTPGVHHFRLRQVDFDGAFQYSPVVEVQVDVPSSFALSPAHPNPFNPTTTFELAVAQEQHVRVEVFDMIGRRIRVLHDGVLPANKTQTFMFEAGGLPSGHYMYRITGERFQTSKSVTLLK